MVYRTSTILLVLFLSNYALADWQKFESDNFVLYSEENADKSVAAIRLAEIQLNVLERLFPTELKENANKLELFLLDRRGERSNLPRRPRGRAFGIYLQRPNADMGVVYHYRGPSMGAVPLYYIANTDLSNYPYWYLQGIELLT